MEYPYMLEKLISGFQTGVDRAVLDLAMQRQFPCGGWAPSGCQAEDGVLPKRYPIQGCKSHDERIATELNIIESDGTLIITRGRPMGETAMGRVIAERRAKHLLVIDLDQESDYRKAAAIIKRWLENENIRILNVMGPRESRCNGIYNDTRELMECLYGMITG